MIKARVLVKWRRRFGSMYTHPTLALFGNSTRSFVHLGRNFVIIWYDLVSPNPPRLLQATQSLGANLCPVSVHVRRGEVAKKWVMCLQYQRSSERVGENGNGFGIVERKAMCGFIHSSYPSVALLGIRHSVSEVSKRKLLFMCVEICNKP